MSRTILENLWQVGGDHLSAPGDAAVYLVRFGDSAALVDAGTGHGHAQITANISRCLPPAVALEYLFLTHCHYDHTGGAEALRQTYDCRLVAHAEDAVFLEAGDDDVTAATWYGTTFDPLRIDVKLEGDQALIPINTDSVTAIHIPGHSPGSVAYTITREDQLVLFGQDVHGPIHPALKSNEAQYQTSLDKLMALEADLLCEGHFGVIYGKTAVRKFIQSYKR